MTTFVLNAGNPAHRKQPTACSLRVDGDKSISHRAVMFASLAQGESDIEGFLHGEDTRCTAQILRLLGVSIVERSATSLRVRGVGLHGLRGSTHDLDCGNAGTGMRLLSGLLAGQRFDSTLIGDASLSKRPMRRILAPLRAMGATIQGTAADTAPLHIKALAGKLRGTHYDSPVASAQVKSCVLLAGLYADAETSVREPEATRDHTERMLRSFGASLSIDGLTVCITPEPILRAQSVQIPADPSSAAFFAAAAALVPGLSITLRDVCTNPRRTGIFDTLQEMGASVRYENQRTLGAEPVADIVVTGAALRGIRVPAARVADMIDEFPIFMICAACAEGESVVADAAELRVKESDRIAAMVAGLQQLGAHCQEYPDGVRIQGLGNASADPCLGRRNEVVKIDSKGDHRIAMSFAIASLRCLGGLEILDCENVATSFPSFAQLARQAGIDLEVQKAA